MENKTYNRMGEDRGEGSTFPSSASNEDVTDDILKSLFDSIEKEKAENNATMSLIEEETEYSHDDTGPDSIWGAINRGSNNFPDNNEPLIDLTTTDDEITLGGPSDSNPLLDFDNSFLEEVISNSTQHLEDSNESILAIGENQDDLETEEFDLDAHLTQLQKEVDNTTCNLKRISNFVIKDVHSELNKYFNSTLTEVIRSINTGMKIEEYIPCTHNNENLQKIFKVLNLQENRRRFNESSIELKSDLEMQYMTAVRGQKETRTQMEELINNFKMLQINDLNNIFNEESNKLDKKTETIKNEIKSGEGKLIQQSLSEHKDMFEEADRLKAEVDELKEQIVSLLGKNFIMDSDGKIKMPKNKKQLRSLINKIENSLGDLEVKDRSFFNSISSKVFKVLFYPTRYTQGDAKSFVMLINTLVFVILALKFKDLFILMFTSTIFIDLYSQIKLSKNKNDFILLAEFAKKSDDIIRSFTDTVVEEKRTVAREKSTPVVESLTVKSNDLRDSIVDAFNLKVEEIDESFDEDELIDKVSAKYRQLEEQLTNKFNAIINDFDDSLIEFKVQLEQKISGAINEVNELPNLDIYGEGNDNSITYNNVYKVGRLNIEGTNLGMDLIKIFNEGSYLVEVESEEKKLEALEKVKLMVMQQMTHIRPGNLRINVIDLNELGNEFMDIYTAEEELFRFILTDDAYGEFLKEQYNEIGKRYKKALKTFGSVTEYNGACLAMNEEPFKYEINIIYNIKDDMYRNQMLRTIITEGGQAGITSILLADKTSLMDAKGEISNDTIKALGFFDYKIYYEGRWFATPQRRDNITKGPLLVNIKPLVPTPLEFKRGGVTAKFQEIEEILNGNKEETVFYSELQEKYAKDLFTKDTLTGIDICVGFRDNNLDKPEYVRIDDELVHGLMAGKTGAGKSNTINVLLMNLLRNYSPEWLELYMIDFKNVEFNFYTEVVSTDSFSKKMCKIPHTSMIAGTTDPEYALSVFQNALKEMERRKKILGKGIKHNGEIVTFKKIQSYNEFVLKYNLKGQINPLDGKVIKILPRILMLLDEFQVMFKMDDIDKLATIKNLIERLSREARSMGIHMFFTSQSMGGTLSDDVKGQFAMRFCLSATEEVSKEVLGNGASSKLKGKGFIYMSGTMERKEEDNKLYKVPFIPEDYITETLEEIREACANLNKEYDYIPCHRQEFYDEKDRHLGSELRAYLNHPSIKSKRNAILLGPKVIYKSVSTPENFAIGNDDGDNMLITANDKVALANLVNTLTDNLSTKERTRIVICNCDRTLDGMLNEKHLDDFYKDYLVTNDALSLIEDLVDNFIYEEPTDKVSASDKFDAILNGSNKQAEEDDYVPEKFDPNIHNRWYVFFIGIHKAEGFNEDYVDDEYMSPLMKLLKLGPASGVTTILNYKTPFKVNKMLPQINHRISARVDEDVSYTMFDDKTASRLFTEDNLNFGLYRNNLDNRRFRFKLYEFEYDKELLRPKELEDVMLV